MKYSFLLYLLVANFFCAIAQKMSSQVPGAVIVEVDFKNGIVKDEAYVPYFTKVVFQGVVDSTIVNLRAFTHKGECPPDTLIGVIPHGFTRIGGWNRPPRSFAGFVTNASIISAPNESYYYRPNASYCLLVREVKEDSELDPKQKFVSIKTRAELKDYIKVDIGPGVGFHPTSFIGFSTVHFCPFPVNEYLNFSDDFTPVRQILMRTSAFFGIAPLNIPFSTNHEVKSFSSVGNVVFGIGYRSPFVPIIFSDGPASLKTSRLQAILREMRANIGLMLFKQPSPSTLVPKDMRKITPYISLSYDASLKDLFAPVALLFGLK